METAVSKIFWPQHVSVKKRKSGYLVGWNIRSFIACVATVIDDLSLTDLEAHLRSIESDPKYGYIKDLCGVAPVVLGIWLVDEDVDGEIFQMDEIADRKQAASIWMTIEQKNNLFPVLRSVYCLGSRYQVTCEVIFYDQPSETTPISLDPLVLDISFSEKGERKENPSAKVPPTILKKLALHTEAIHARTESKSEINWVINQMNSGKFLEKLLTTRNKVDQILPVPLKEDKRVKKTRVKAIQEEEEEEEKDDKEEKEEREDNFDEDSDHMDDEENSENELSLLEDLGSQNDDSDNDDNDDDQASTSTSATPSAPAGGINQASTSKPTGSTFSFNYLIYFLLRCIIYYFRCFAEFMFWVLSTKLPYQSKQQSLREASSTVLQIHLRLKQATFWPLQYLTVKQQWNKNLKLALALNISMYNTIWLVINDVLLGIALGYFVYWYGEWVLQLLDSYVNYYAIERVESMVKWLMGWPSGIKLNNNLDNFLGQMFLLFTSWWKGLHSLTRLILPRLITLSSYMGIFGATTIVAIYIDLITVLFLNIWFFYNIGAYLYNWQLMVINSLFHLFRGQKVNVLRNRIDSCDYDVEQLLLGTVLFTLLFFLMPTTTAYYILFSGFRLYVLILQGLMQTILVLLNHFPLFALMLRFLNPNRLPGGFNLEVCDEDMFTKRRKGWFQFFQGNHDKTTEGSTKTTSKPIRTENETNATHAHKTENERKENPARKKKHVRAVSIGNWQPPSASAPINQVTYLVLKPRPIPFSSIFFQYILLGERLLAHYRPSYIIKCLTQGQVILPVRKLQHPLISNKTPPLKDYWSFLQQHVEVSE